VRKLAAIALAAALGAIASVSAQAQQSGLPEVSAALQVGEADHALSLLSSLPGAEAQSAEAHNLRCRVLFTLQEWDQAGSECEQAVQLDGQNSDYHMWLGRTLGERASRASFLSAYSLAKRTREEFEQATQLDPHNAAALADLGEFYSSAPGVVGGGMDKAQGVVEQLDHVDPARAAELRARIAEGNKDYATAEREFHNAIKASHQPAFQWMTLGSYLRRRQQWSAMQTAIESGYAAAQRDRHAAVALYNGATVLIRANRNLDLAAKMLDAYLASPLKTEEAPAFAAYVARARVAAQLGDKTTAKRDHDAALALAAEYKPAQNLKF
jgi:tetratricopeptide (TPR) repeat protein